MLPQMDGGRFATPVEDVPLLDKSGQNIRRTAWLEFVSTQLAVPDESLMGYNVSDILQLLRTAR